MAEAERISRETADEKRYELVEVSLDRESAGTYLRIYLDKPGGISLQDCEVFHRAVQPKLDHVDYDFLEVCSPGLDRPIRDENEAKKAAGCMVRVRLYRTADVGREFTGVLLGMDADGLRIRTGSGERLFPKKDIALVKREIDMGILDNAGDAAGEAEE